MKSSSAIDKEITFLLRQMEKAMTEVRRQVEVYEKNLKAGKMVKSPQITSQYKDV